MTIQTDYEEIEKGCDDESNKSIPDNLLRDRYKQDKWGYFYDCGEENNFCNVCQAKRQTFIVENLKRINEMIEFLEDYKKGQKKMLTYQILKIEKKLNQLKADKQFLEEKQNGN